jgi:hypothetical protein
MWFPCLAKPVAQSKMRSGEAAPQPRRLVGSSIRFGSLSEAQIGTVQPPLLPVWLEVSGLVLLTYGLSSARREAPVEKPQRRARKEKRAPRRPTAQDGVTAWVEAYTAKHGRSPTFARLSAFRRRPHGGALVPPPELTSPRNRLRGAFICSVQGPGTSIANQRYTDKCFNLTFAPVRRPLKLRIPVGLLASRYGEL